MTGYVFCVVEAVHDAEGLTEYRAAFPETVVPYGGERVVGGTSRQEPVEGVPATVLLFRFPTYDAALAWYRSPEYTAVKALRESAAEVRITIAEGLS